MRSLFLAAGLALVLHALLFTLDAGWVRRHAFTTARPEPIRLSMSYKKPEPNLPPPEQKPLEVKKEPLLPKKQPQKKISETKPVRKIKPPRKETAPPIERKEQIQPAPAHTGPPPEAEPTIEREAPGSPMRRPPPFRHPPRQRTRPRLYPLLQLSKRLIPTIKKIRRRSIRGWPGEGVMREPSCWKCSSTGRDGWKTFASSGRAGIPFWTGRPWRPSKAGCLNLAGGGRSGLRCGSRSRFAFV